MSRRRLDILDRLAEKILVGDGCWEWVGAKNYKGYGLVHTAQRGKVRRAHRVVYELLVGPIPPRLQLDHLCRNRGCVRPAHLEPVTNRENVRRSPLMGQHNRWKTHCRHGHPFDEANTYRRPGGGRKCRACAREYAMTVGTPRRRRATVMPKGMS